MNTIPFSTEANCGCNTSIPSSNAHSITEDKTRWHSVHVCLMLDQRLGRWSSIKPALRQLLVFVGVHWAYSQVPNQIEIMMVKP